MSFSCQPHPKGYRVCNENCCFSFEISSLYKGSSGILNG